MWYKNGIPWRILSFTPLRRQYHLISSGMATPDSKDDTKAAAEVDVQNATVDNYVVGDGEYFAEIDQAYLTSTWFPKFFRSVLFQMILFGA